jgi:hypothetical protein
MIDPDLTQKINDTAISLAGTVTSIKSFGAKGDGVTDDTLSIQNTIDSLLGIGGTVLLPKGQYKTTATISIPEGVIVRGISSMSSIVQYYGSGVAIKMVYNSRNNGLETVSIVRKKASIAGTIGLLLEANLFFVAKDVRVLDFETGYRIDGKDLWCASNVFYNIFSLRCTFGIHITANVDKQSNHNIFIGGYIVGEYPEIAGSKGISIERGDSNRFYGTAVEDYDIGYHFMAVDQGGNSATNPRVERCNINYLIDANTSNTFIIDPFGSDNIQDNSQSSLIFTRVPIFKADGLYFGNEKWVKFLDSGGAKKDVIGVDVNDNVIYKTPSYFNTHSHSFEVADANNVHQKELTVKSEEVSIRRYLKHGTIGVLPLANSTQRRKEVFIEGGLGIADKLCVCVKKQDNTYAWFDKISGLYV